LSSYLAAAIAKADSVRTALYGLKLSLAAFILPFIFAVSPELLLLDTSPIKTVRVVGSALIGVFALASALENYLFGKTNLIQRALLFMAALVLIKPGVLTDLIGLGIVVVITVIQYIKGKKTKITIKEAEVTLNDQGCNIRSR